MKKIVLVGYLLLVSAFAMALTPVEGILYGEADLDYQTDPLSLIFIDPYDKSNVSENSKLKIYQKSLNLGVFLENSCSRYDKSKYDTVEDQKKAKKMVASTLQYIGLDTTIRAIGAYAKKLEIDQEGYSNLVTNITTNYCSKNLTLVSRNQIKKILMNFYENPNMEMIPSVANSPFMTEKFKVTSESLSVRRTEFELLIRNFRNFCSWGGDPEDFRMLIPYLNNKFVMSHVINNLNGTFISYNKVKSEANLFYGPGQTQVKCENIVCRKSTLEEFQKSFPKSIGSTGIYQDLVKLYCHDLKHEDYKVSDAIPQVKEWIKKQELEDPLYEVSFFYSLLTGVPDATFGLNSFIDIPFLAKSSIDERWGQWARTTLGHFSTNLLFEESLKIKAVPKRNPSSIRTDLFSIELNVTLGQMDAIIEDEDKLGVHFSLGLSKNFLRNAISKWNSLSKDLDEDGKAAHKAYLAKYINELLAPKKNLFRQKMWTEDFADIIVDELLSQLNLYQGSYFDSYKDEMLQVPVKFNYGVFALGYLRYRADVQTGRLKLTL